MRISARPLTDGSFSPGSSASGIALSPTGTGTGSQSLTFTSGEASVDQTRFRMHDADFNTLLLEFFVPVDLHWGPNSIANITFDPPFPECLAHDQRVTVAYDYAASDPEGCYTWARGADDAQQPIIGQFFTASPLLPASGRRGSTRCRSTGSTWPAERIPTRWKPATARRPGA